MKNGRALVQGKILPSLVVFAGPFLAASILQALYGAVDLIVVGQFADSADGFTENILFMYLSVKKKRLLHRIGLFYNYIVENR